jgi:hypothetical protein
MTTRRAMKGVLENLLGTFTSRNTDHEGYWLLGFLVSDLDRRTIELLSGDAASVNRPPWNIAAVMANDRFRDQMRKYGLPLETVRAAELELERLPGAATALINGETWEGFKVRFGAKATMDDGRVYERERRVFVAPHSSRELRSTRWDASRSRVPYSGIAPRDSGR